MNIYIYIYISWPKISVKWGKQSIILMLPWALCLDLVRTNFKDWLPKVQSYISQGVPSDIAINHPTYDIIKIEDNSKICNEQPTNWKEKLEYYFPS